MTMVFGTRVLKNIGYLDPLGQWYVLDTPVPNTIKGMFFSTRVLKCWVSGTPGIDCSSRGPLGPEQNSGL